MAKLTVHEVFRLPARKQFVIAGVLEDGTVWPGMHALVWLDGQAYWSIAVKSIEFIDRIAIKECLVALVCDEQGDEDAATCQALCPLGTAIEVSE
jgi:hypothetical protein